ncbi:mechanosensitive ion channel [Acidobacteria bacterium ACD]|nr:MAG: hypothetical protein EDX89_07075 [Acidobacteriota bacterium]MCE7958825.1 hypothetical protein [Acidobacteria bacterium ACB2]MDL1948719.1 mechanosensitive ion channel [Acidobacteria bacterium ACD]
MPLLLFVALEAVTIAALVVAVRRVSRRSELVSRVRFSLCAAALLVGVLLLEPRLAHPGRDSVTTAAAAVLVLVALHVVLQVVDHLVWKRLLEPRHVSVPRLLFDVFNFLVLAGVGAALLKSLYSVNLTGFLVTSTVLSAILGLSLQDVLASLMAGIALQIEGSVSPREWVRVGDKEGEVVQTSWRTITLKAREGHHVVLPNAKVAREELVNYSRPGPLERLRATVGVAYAHPPGEVKAALERAALGAEGVSPSPPPEAIVTAFGESAVEYDLRFFTLDFARAHQVRDAVLTRVWYALRRAGMEIPFPRREVAVHHVSDAQAAERAEALRRDSFDVLRSVRTFHPLTDEQVRSLARTARLERYTAGEALVRQGDEGRSLFVVRSGQVRVERTDADGARRELAKLGPSSFFGETSLLTGEPRSASVVALTELEVVVVEKDAFGAVILSDPRLVRDLSLELERRAQEEARLSAEPGRAAATSVEDSGSFLTRIQRFFGIEG